MYTKSGARLNGNRAIAIVIQMIGGELNNATTTARFHGLRTFDSNTSSRSCNRFHLADDKTQQSARRVRIEAKSEDLSP